jgi:nucleoid-associated protein YgaU
MSSLSERYYGSVKYVRFLIDSNPQIADPDKLTIGMSVKIPAKPASSDVPTTASGARARPADPTRRTYQVQPGDTFYEIARSQLGSSSRWQELFELNKEIVHGDPKRLHVGQVLVLPPP